MNAINFLDNMDGIVGGVSAICALAFAALLAIWGWPHEALFALAGIRSAYRGIRKLATKARGKAAPVAPGGAQAD